MRNGEHRSPPKVGANPLLLRVRACDAVLTRFDGRPFVWGQSDCLRLAAHVLRELGHAPPLRQAGVYRTAIGAKRALKRTGHPTLPAWLDSWGLKRIPPALALPADIVAYPGLFGDMPALTVQLTNGRVFGFLGDRATAMNAEHPVAAWSVA